VYVIGQQIRPVTSPDSEMTKSSIEGASHLGASPQKILDFLKLMQIGLYFQHFEDIDTVDIDIR
jgi:hypothetical protein